MLHGGCCASLLAGMSYHWLPRAKIRSVIDCTPCLVCHANVLLILWHAVPLYLKHMYSCVVLPPHGYLLVHVHQSGCITVGRSEWTTAAEQALVLSSLVTLPISNRIHLGFLGDSCM